jgi:hypothetical protein
MLLECRILDLNGVVCALPVVPHMLQALSDNLIRRTSAKDATVHAKIYFITRQSREHVVSWSLWCQFSKGSTLVSVMLVIDIDPRPALYVTCLAVYARPITCLCVFPSESGSFG